MEPMWILIYYCYGLNFEDVAESKKEEEIQKIIDGENGVAGKDARKMKYIGCVPATDFANAILQRLI